jgi:putative copper resistance protein D
LVLGVRRPQTGAVRRFSTLALWCFAITVATGIASAAARLDRWSDFTDTLYGTIVLAKAAALVALGGFGWWHRRRSLPALATGRHRVFVRVAVVELFVLAATMGLAVALGRTPPPNELGHIVFDTPLTPLIRWTPEPLLLMLAVAAVTAYVSAVRRAGTWPRASTARWVTGWALLVATGTARLADIDPSGTVRVVQAVTVALVVPALLVSARPGRLLASFGERPATARAAGWSRVKTMGDAREIHLLRSPAVAVTLYSVTGFLVVVAAAYRWADTRHGVHLLVHLAVVAAGCLTWSPVVSPKATEADLVRSPTP